MVKLCVNKDIINVWNLRKFYNIINLKRTSFLLTDQLLFFSPIDKTLSKDGYFEYLTPKGMFEGQSFIRRLWVGGSMEVYRPLIDNQQYSCQEKLLNFRRMKNSTFITIERVISHENNAYICEQRKLMYTNTTANDDIVPANFYQENCQIIDQHTFREMDVIKYGQLTLNPHRIHWDKNYSIENEKYKNIIVPGPFSLQFLLAKVKNQYGNISVKCIRYKHINILYPEVLTEICHNTAMDMFWIRDSIDKNKIYVTMRLI